jgi:two-component system OmpR family sensor kinase
LAILLLLIITARYAINLALKPLLSFVDVASSFSGGRRDSRWDVKTSSGEVEVLGKSFNQMLDTVNESIDQKEEYAESLKRFIADASHELKTPLTVIQGFSEMLSKDMINDKAKKKSAYQRVERESRRMSRLVEDLLTLAKLDQGSSITFSKEEIDPIIKEVLENATISAKGHRFAFISKTQDISLNVDKNSIHRLLSNLVSNAYKYSPDNSLIEIKTIVTDNFLEIYISDEGIGIPANERVLVFERFYKTKDNPLSNNSKLEKEIESSTGLGLAIAKSIAQKHGGDLECITPLLSGATFKLTLPIS